ncbi:MAG: phage tail protein, partial [Bacteroidota bacterium]
MSIPKTPGVYIDRLNMQAAVIEQPDTAIPAFIGYTATNTREDESLLNVPVRIANLEEYIAIFGGAPAERSLSVTLDPDYSYRFAEYSSADT